MIIRKFLLCLCWKCKSRSRLQNHDTSCRRGRRSSSSRSAVRWVKAPVPSSILVAVVKLQSRIRGRGPKTIPMTLHWTRIIWTRIRKRVIRVRLFQFRRFWRTVIRWTGWSKYRNRVIVRDRMRPRRNRWMPLWQRITSAWVLRSWVRADSEFTSRKLHKRMMSISKHKKMSCKNSKFCKRKLNRHKWNRTSCKKTQSSSFRVKSTTVCTACMSRRTDFLDSSLSTNLYQIYGAHLTFTRKSAIRRRQRARPERMRMESKTKRKAHP